LYILNQFFRSQIGIPRIWGAIKKLPNNDIKNDIRTQTKMFYVHPNSFCIYPIAFRWDDTSLF